MNIQPRTPLVDIEPVLQRWLIAFGPAPARAWSVGEDENEPWSGPPTNTQRNYRIHVNRFAAWLRIEHSKSVFEATAADCSAYIAFIQDPQPRERWCGRAAAACAQPPFRGPLRGESLRTTYHALKSFFNFLLDERLVSTNPWVSVTRPKPGRSGEQSKLTMGQFWPLIQSELEALDASRKAARARVAIQVLVGVPLHLNELVGLRLRDFVPIPAAGCDDSNEHVDRWALVVRDRVYQLPKRSLDGLRTAFDTLGVRLGEGREVDRYLLAVDRKGTRGFSVDGLRAELSMFLKNCADRLGAQGSPDADEFRRMAIWWLRARASPTSDLADADERKQRMLVQMQRMWRSAARGLGK